MTFENYEGAMNETRKMCFFNEVSFSHDGEVSLPFIRPQAVRVPLSRLIILLSDKKQIVPSNESSRSWNDY